MSRGQLPVRDELDRRDHLFSGVSAYSVMTQQVQDAPPRLRAVRPDVPADLERLVQDLLQKRPEDRPPGATDVYERLVPFAADLGPLPGVLQPPGKPNPVQMYAWVVPRIVAPPESTPPPAPAPGPITRHDLTEARKDAYRLTGESRYSQAAEVLGEVEPAAQETFGGTDRDVVRIRYDLANALFEGGDYRRAAAVYEALAADLADARSAPDMRFDCQVKQAICHAMTGRAGQALEQLDTLLEARRAAHGGDDPRTLELRKQIALLHLGAGHREAARRTLSDLLTDVRRLPGGTQPSPAEVADLLASIRTPGPHPANG
jgi:hypothetical protein